MEGFFYPRWLPDNYGGYGYPDFVFYQPGFFYSVLAFSFIFGDVIRSFYASIIFFMFAGGVGVYFLLRRIYGGAGALPGALIFCLTPYMFVNIYVRGDLAEFASMALIPWPLYFLNKLEEKLRNRKDFRIDFAFFSIASGALVYMHPFTAMFFYPALLIFSAIFSFNGGKKHFFKTIFLCGCGLFAGALISSPYWLSAALMKDYVNYKAAVSGEMEAHHHLLSPFQLFSLSWGFGGSASGVEADDMSFQLGFPHFLMACAGLVLSANKKSRVFFVLYICSILPMLSFMSFLWKTLPVLGIIQFPWRILSVIALLQAICVGAFTSWFSGKTSPSIKIPVYCGIFFLLIFLYKDMFFMRETEDPSRDVLIHHRTARKFVLASYSSFNEFFPSYIINPPNIPRGERDILDIPNADAIKVKEMNKSSIFRKSFLISSIEPTSARVLQFYFPGMCVKSNYEDISGKIKILDDGTFTFPIPAGENQFIEIYYAGVPFDVVIGVMALSGLAAVSAAIFYWGRKNKCIINDRNLYYPPSLT